MQIPPSLLRSVGRALLAGGVCLLSVPIVAAILRVPDNAAGLPGSTVVIPIEAIPADGILGADIRLEFDPAVLTATAVFKTPISERFNLTSNLTVPGRVTISLFGTVPLSGSGPIVDIQFTVQGGAGSTTVLDLTRGDLNEVPATLDDGFFVACASVDTDGDTLIDCLDPDDDGDGVADEVDCAPLNANASVPPVEVTSVRFDDVGTDAMTWVAQGTGFRYDVAGELVSALRTAGNVTGAECFQDDVATPAWSDPGPPPPVGDALYYIVRAQNACGAGTYGFASSGAERVPAAACP